MPPSTGSKTTLVQDCQAYYKQPSSMSSFYNFAVCAWRLPGLLRPISYCYSVLPVAISYAWIKGGGVKINECLVRGVNKLHCVLGVWWWVLDAPEYSSVGILHLIHGTSYAVVGKLKTEASESGLVQRSKHIAVAKFYISRTLNNHCLLQNCECSSCPFSSSFSFCLSMHRCLFFYPLG